MDKLTPIVKKILLINVCIYVLSCFFNFNFITHFGMRDIHSSYFRPYQIITHLFVHASFAHLFSNMITLCTFGPILESTLGSKKFFSLYFVTGIGAALFYLICLFIGNSSLNSFYVNYLSNPDPIIFSDYIKNNFNGLYNSYYGFIYDFLHDENNPAYIEKSISIVKQLCSLKFDVPIVGASGAIFGLLSSFAFLFPNAQLGLILVPVPIKAKYFVFLYGLYELRASFIANPGDNVAHLAHLGGILIAYLFLKIFYKGNY